MRVNQSQKELLQKVETELLVEGVLQVIVRDTRLMQVLAVLEEALQLVIYHAKRQRFALIK